MAKSIQQPNQLAQRSRHVSLVALPDAVVSTMFGIFDVMNALAFIDPAQGGTRGRSLFQVDIVGEAVGPMELASGVPVTVGRAIDTIETTDIVIVPSVLLRSLGWTQGRYARLVDWLRLMHDRGAVICSACSGIFLLAETGLFDGREATVHFAYARAFGAAYPAVAIRPERALVISGRREELVSSGASTTWHDLALYLIGDTPARRPPRRSRACSRCSGTRTGSRHTSSSRERPTTAMPRSRPRSGGCAIISRLRIPSSR